MSAVQQLLFPDPQPLVERLGREFLRELPECPGVYLMRDAADAVLYVGKAKNLRKRLCSYRVANPDRLPRRHLRLLRAVVRIELQICADETAALHCEAVLLRQLRPKFNRAGTWPAPPRFLAFRDDSESISLKIAAIPEPGWHAIGPFGARVIILREVLVRLIWLQGLLASLWKAGKPSKLADKNVGATKQNRRGPFFRVRAFGSQSATTVVNLYTS